MSGVSPIDHGMSLQEAVDFLNRESFTATCLAKDGKILSAFVTLESLKGFNSSAPVAKRAKSLPASHQVPEDTSILDALARLAENMAHDKKSKFLFCTKRSTVTGIITTADLNKPELNACIMAELIEFETLLNNLIEQQIPDWISRFRNSEQGDFEKAEKQHNAAQKNDAALGFIHYLPLRHKLMLIRTDPVLRDKVFGSQVHGINKIGELRNTVAHARGLFAPRKYNLRDHVEELFQQTKYVAGISQRMRDLVKHP
jgi:hypothetical protein